MKKNKVIVEGKTKEGKVKRKVKTFLSDGIERKVGQGSHEVLKVETPEYYNLVKRVYQLLKEGLRTNEVFATLCVEDDAMTETKFIDLARDAYRYAENETLKERETVWQTHMARYENVYEKAMGMRSYYRDIPLDKNNPKDIEQIRVKCTQALAALQYKEELVGLHDKKVILEFKDGEATIIENEKDSGHGIPGYNLDNLSLDEQIELLAYIKEARIVPITGIQRVVIKTRKIEIDLQSGNRHLIEEVQKIDKLNVRDVEFEEMPPEVISKFQDTTPKEVGPDIDPHIIDSRGTGENKFMYAEDIQQKVQNKVLDELRAKLKEKNERKNKKK